MRLFWLISRILSQNKIKVISNKTFESYVKYLYVLQNNMDIC